MFLIQARREINLRMPDGLGLAGTGLPDDDIPGQLVDVLAAALELLKSCLEFPPHLVQVGAFFRVADRPWRRSGLCLNGGGELFALAAGSPAVPKVISAKKQEGQHQDDQRDPDAERAWKGECCSDRAKAQRPQPTFHQSLNF